MQGSPFNSARARLLSCPSTTKIGLRPAASAVRTARRSTVAPSNSRKSLLVPMRLEVPAARMRPAISGIVDPFALFAEMARIAAGAHRQHLGDDAHRHLLGSFGAQVEPHGRIEILRPGHAQFLQHLLLARAAPAAPGARAPVARARPTRGGG